MTTNAKKITPAVKKERVPRKPKFEQKTTSVESAIADCFSDMEGLKEELQSWYDNLPEAFQNGDKGSQLQDAMSSIENPSEPKLSDVTDLVSKIDVTYMLSTKAKKSRANRRDDAVCMLRGAIDAIENKVEELRNEHCDSPDDEQQAKEDVQKLEMLIEDLSSAADEFDSVEFPGMYS